MQKLNSVLENYGGALYLIFAVTVISTYVHNLTPNRPVIHTCFTYPILNMDDFSILNASLGYGDST